MFHYISIISRLVLELVFLVYWFGGTNCQFDLVSPYCTLVMGNPELMQLNCSKKLNRLMNMNYFMCTTIVLHPFCDVALAG